MNKFKWIEMCFFVGPIWKEEEQWKGQTFLKLKELKGKLKHSSIFMLMNGKII